ncbi:MAG: IS30 family transposase [Clostridia bacterium]|nr:IS30 family transposase [Clostridia bacterium]NCD03871.1 IS30 family transposase [Clostridia bacterium]
MDCQDYITVAPERKRGQHLQREDRGAIQCLKREGYSNRAISQKLNCSPSTIANELKRGTPCRKSKKGRAPGYSAKRGETVYKANRKHAKRRHKLAHCTRFMTWTVEKVRTEKWSLDACVGHARLHKLFPEDQMVCTRTLYNELWAGNLPLSVTEVPEALKRKQAKEKHPRMNKKVYGKSIDERPEIAALRVEEGHWEGDTVVGKRDGKESVVLSLVEKVTEAYLAFRIPSKTSEAVTAAMKNLRAEYGDKFPQVFKTITVDNGSEFADFAQTETWGSKVYFAHPYSSWERAQNERHNGLFRAFAPKGVSMEQFSDEYILMAADKLNGRPRKKLGYYTPEELFDKFLDRVYQL